MPENDPLEGLQVVGRTTKRPSSSSRKTFKTGPAKVVQVGRRNPKVCAKDLRKSLGRCSAKQGRLGKYDVRVHTYSISSSSKVGQVGKTFFDLLMSAAEAASPLSAMERFCANGRRYRRYLSHCPSTSTSIMMFLPITELVLHFF